jgi:hypothetical protein
MSSTLIFSIAQNGYGLGWQACLRSQAAYAERLGCAHCTVSRPLRVEQPSLSAWLKLPLLLEALRAHEWVAFIDADVRVQPTAPDFRTVEQPGKAVYMANGRSGQLNSGVIFAKRSAAAIAFLERVMASLTRDLAEHVASVNRKFENGNVIFCARGDESVALLDTRWNNTFKPDLDDYFRHYTGPLRQEYRRPLREKLAFALVKRLLKPRVAAETVPDARFAAQLKALTAASLRLYPALASAAQPTAFAPLPREVTP